MVSRGTRNLVRGEHGAGEACGRYGGAGAERDRVTVGALDHWSSLGSGLTWTEARDDGFGPRRCRPRSWLGVCPDSDRGQAG
jgi:hypothetical protein